MKTIGRKIATAAVLAAGLAIVSGAPAYAQAGPCADVTFAPAVLSQFPQAPSACRGIVERDGAKYAQFSAEVEWVRSGSVHAHLLNPDGSRTESVTFHPDRDTRVQMGNTSVRFWELQRGDRISIYLPSDRWEIVTVADVASAPVVTTVPVAQAPAAPPPQAAPPPAALPATASPMPLIGLLGGLFLALGGMLSFVRRRSTTR